jgi:RimJ/RimL family protein N-acetyltransferase
MQIDPNQSIWQGKRVRLRAFESIDWEDYYAWNDDTEQSRALYFIPPPGTADAQRRWAEKEAARERDGDNFRFVIEEIAERRLVGDLTINGTDQRVGCFSYGVNIARDHRGRGYAKDAILIALRYYFGELRYHKVTVRVYGFNKASMRLHESLGYQKEGQIRDVVYTHGQYYDELMYGLTSDEFRRAYPDWI